MTKPLSTQQIEGARLFAQGFGSTDVALTLGVSRNTPSNWRKRADFRALVFTLSNGAVNIDAEREAWTIDHPEITLRTLKAP